MKFLFFLIFILLIGGGGGFFFVLKYQKKIASLSMETMLLKKQLSKLQTNYKKFDNLNNNFTIKFLNIDNYYGIIPKNSKVYLFPNDSSPTLNNITIAMEVGILEKALVDNSIWYYVALPIESDINCRGWIRESLFSSLSSSQNYVTSRK